MAFISEFTDESDGGEPNKKPQEPPKNPEEEGQEETRMVSFELLLDYPAMSLISTVFRRLMGSSGLELAITERRLTVSFESLPYDVIELCVARVSRSDHQAMSVVSSFFRRLVASPGLEVTRSQLAITERVLYALIGFPPGEFPRWYVLRPRLRRVNPLPYMPLGSAVVAIGSEIYVIGGCLDGRSRKPEVFAIDCRYHTSRSLPSMKVARFRAAAGVIDRVIYVVGGCEMRHRNWIERFDLDQRVWLETTVSPWAYFPEREFVAYAVMEDKIFALARDSFYLYEPKEVAQDNWHEFSYGGDPWLSVWQASSCVVDDLLYTIDPWCRLGQPLVVLDPNSMLWRPVPVRGNALFDPFLCYDGSKMANLDGKLVVLVVDRRRWLNCYEGEKEMVRVQIALERLQGGEIRGTVEAFDVVLATSMWPWIEHCVAVTV